MTIIILGHLRVLLVVMPSSEMLRSKGIAVCLRLVDRNQGGTLEGHVHTVLGANAAKFALRRTFKIDLPDDQVLINSNSEDFFVIG